jgi:hypothetical protein
MRSYHIFLGIFILISAITASAASVPSLVLKNQQGEVSKNFVIGGSSQISVKFMVDSSNANGLGVSGLTSYGGADAPAAVYMNTSQTPAVGNPNPSPGYIIVKLARGYSSYVLNGNSFHSPPSGSLVNVTSGLQQGKPYIISSVGTTTAAQWQALGLYSSLVPAVSQSFIAVTGAAGVGTGVVAPPVASGSGVLKVELVGSASLDANTPDGTGGQLILQVLGATSSSVTTLNPKAPADQTILELSFSMAPQPGSPI